MEDPQKGTIYIWQFRSICCRAPMWFTTAPDTRWYCCNCDKDVTMLDNICLYNAYTGKTREDQWTELLKIMER